MKKIILAMILDGLVILACLLFVINIYNGNLL
jgi:hypothetical protein